MVGKPAFLTVWPFAHRGLHGPGVSENGMRAFDAAISAGFGIECDVRLSRDGQAIVHHDATLRRMSGLDDSIADRDAEWLERQYLADGSTLPRLAALLDRCRNGTPLLIEIKVVGRVVAPLCAAVARDLEERAGAQAAIMSFNPLAVRWFARHRPDVVRGLVVTQQGKEKWRGWMERTLALWLCRPDFLACDIRDLPTSFAMRARRRGLSVLSWTVRSPDDRARAALHADQIIFEGAA